METQNQFKPVKYTFLILSFLTALVTYMMTVQESVPFWDCSEFSAASILQQVPHPPGAPLFLMIGKLFDIFIPYGDPGWKLNLVSAVSSAFVIMLVFLITYKLINNLKGTKPTTMLEAIALYGASYVGAAAFTFSDTFWFNAVESEVYAMSTLFVALMIYFIMKWNEEADKPGHEKYILLLSYIVGLSTGVHLLGILTIPSIVYIIYFKKYKFSWKGFFVSTVIGLFILRLIYPGIVKYIPAFLAGHWFSRNDAREYPIENSMALTLLAIGVIIGAAFGLWWAYKNKNKVVSLITASFLLVILGYTTYTQILIRANVNPPMNENEPKNFKSLSSYLGREQYGDAPRWPRRHKEDDMFTRNYLSKDGNGDYIYGEWFPPEREEVTRKDGSRTQKIVFNQVNVAGEINYLIKFQMGHMWLRYFMWNFVGRASDEQDADWVGLATDARSKNHIEEMNFGSGYTDKFPIMFFFVPLLIGLLGLLYQFQEDKKMFWAYLVMFLLLGVLAAVEQQQQDPQPRERDYFYTGSFMIWCLWIGMGVYYLILSLSKKGFRTAVVAGILIISFLIVPVNMAVGGWFVHDRGGNFLAFDYSYNILQSAEENAIIFTNGDNDTFPVWYIQDIMGVRRDVRIVNLSLGNTLWYVDQLKNRKPWGTEKIPLSFADDSIQVDEYDDRALTYDYGEKKTVSIPISREIMKKFTNDPVYLANPMFRAEFGGQPMGQGRSGEYVYLYRIQDKLIIDILTKTKWERPVYFSATVGSDAFIGLEKYFRYEGLLMRICPIPQPEDVPNAMDIEITEKCLMNIDNSDKYSKTPKFGFKMRNLTNKNVYYDPVSRRLMQSYRELYMDLARAFYRKDNKKRAVEVLDFLNKTISPELFPLIYQDEYEFGRLYEEFGDTAKSNEHFDKALNNCLYIIKNDHIKQQFKLYEAADRFLGPHRLAARIYERNKDFKNVKEVYDIFANYILKLENSTSATDYERMQNLQFNKLEVLIKKMTIEVDKINYEKDLNAAKEALRSYINEYEKNQDQTSQIIARQLKEKYVELNKNEKLDSNSIIDPYLIQIMQEMYRDGNFN